MAERSPMTAVADTLTVKLSKAREGTIVGVISSSAAASFTVLMEVSADDGVSWETATFTKPDGTTAASFSAAGSGRFDSTGYTHARLRCSAITTPSTGVIARLNSVTSA